MLFGTPVYHVNRAFVYIINRAFENTNIGKYGSGFTAKGIPASFLYKDKFNFKGGFRR